MIQMYERTVRVPSFFCEKIKKKAKKKVNKNCK